MAGLLDNQQDLDEYLRDLLSGTRSRGASFSAGPFYGSVGEQRPAVDAGPGQSIDPTLLASLGFRQGIGPMQAALNAAITRQPDQSQMIAPSAELRYGSPSTGVSPYVGGGVNLLTPPPGADGATTVSPQFRAGVDAPLFGGTGGASISLTPGQQKLLEAYWRKQFGEGRGDIGILGSYSQPDQGRPDFRIGIGGRWRF